jgi:hypothetical protein
MRLVTQNEAPLLRTLPYGNANRIRYFASHLTNCTVVWFIHDTDSETARGCSRVPLLNTPTPSPPQKKNLLQVSNTARDEVNYSVLSATIS